MPNWTATHNQGRKLGWTACAGAALRHSPSPSHSGTALPSLSDSRTASGGLASSMTSGLPQQVGGRLLYSLETLLDGCGV